MPRTKSGEKITTKEFISRWKDGIERVTPLQQSFIQLIGSFIALIGIAWGIIASSIFTQYWLTTILSGAFIVSGIQTLGIYQRYKTFKKIEALASEGTDAE